MEEINLNIKISVFLPEDLDSFRLRRKLPNSLVCGVTNVLEHAINDEILLRWLPEGTEVEIQKIGHDH